MGDQEKVESKAGSQNVAELFAFFNEIGIINQLSSSLFQKRLADGVTVAQFSVLNHLSRVKDGQTPLVLASAFQVPKTSMTHTLAGLEKRGLIAMKPNQNDGRSKCVWLTQAGSDFRTESITALSEDIKRLAPQLDVDDLMTSLPILAKVRSVLDKDRD